AIEGFQQWVRQTEGKVQFVLTDNEQDAQIRVRFDPSSEAGRTDCTYYPERREITQVEIVIGVRGDVPANIQSVSVHEFGHALGIVGHSDNPKDAMYPRYTLGVVVQVSQRDLNAIKTAYCELFEGGQVIASGERTRGLPSSRDEPRKIRIVCDKTRSSR
ncbi:MAG: matrixin family metalloprotease, partial [Fimbriimonadales bacterium]|nr:matrixin family metalloprotease [Fimbriimonadales bacterium]